MYKKIKYFLQQFDGLWSIPASFGAYLLFGYMLYWMFGDGVGSYDPAFMQPLFLAVCVVIGAANASTIGLYFTFRKIFHYLYGKRDRQGRIINLSKTDFIDLPEWGKITVSLLVFFFFFFAVIEVFLALV